MMDVTTTLKKFGLEKAFKYLYKDPDENLKKMLRWAEKFSGKTYKSQIDMIRDADCAKKIIFAIGTMMEKDSIPAMRKTKTALRETDIKPLIHDIRGEGQHIYTTLALTEREACKPGMLMEALQREAGLEGEVRILITRTGLLGENREGKLIPLEQL